MDEFLIYGETITGWALIRAMKDVANMKAGEWGLVYSNLFFTKKEFLPSFVFKDIPVGDFDEYDDYMQHLDTFEDCMKCDPQVGFSLYNACLDDGFNPILDDFYIYILERIQKTATEGQKNLSKQQLKILMEIFVSKEEYEKATLVRDTLEDKSVNKIF